MGHRSTLDQFEAHLTAETLADELLTRGQPTAKDLRKWQVWAETVAAWCKGELACRGIEEAGDG